MIATILYLGFEAVTAVLLLHSLYGKELKIGKYAVLFILFDVGYISLVEFTNIPLEFSTLGNALLVVYTGLEFGFSADRILVNDTLCMLISVALQFVFGVIFSPLEQSGLDVSVYYFLLNFSLLIVSVFFVRKKLLEKISKFFLSKNILVVCVCLADFGILLAWTLSVRSDGGLFLARGLGMLLLVGLFVLLVYSLGKSTLRAKQLQTENEMQRLYNASFEGLVMRIRLRQHEFDNHLNAIYGMCYAYKTYDELVAAQQEYADEVRQENKFNKLLASGNYTLIGFLYNKFLDIDAAGIEVEYHVAVKELESRVPLYVLVEIIGNLLDNAKEALLEREDKKLYVRIIETEEKILIEIANKSEYVNYATIDSFFEKGKSSKGSGRGFGLYHVRQLCKEYDIGLVCTNKEMETANYLLFQLTVEKAKKQ